MSKRSPLTGPEVEKILETAGWVCERCKGSHRQYKNPPNPHVVTVAYHDCTKPLPPGTLRSILENAGLDRLFDLVINGEVSGKGDICKKMLRCVREGFVPA